MCLKLFSRYAERAHQGATVAGDHLRGTAVVVENAPKSLSRHDGASVIHACRQRCEELVTETLVVPFCVIVHYVFGYRCAQVSLTERYEAVETLSTYGENESFRVCVQIRTIRGKAEVSIVIISPGLDSRPGPPSSICWRAWSAREGRC